ncbi:hypothetical protein NMK43_08380 [Bacillus licheniformis]|uniref:hypothetical protein n=1 Tax=Bacillus licheniformis TaxID=1402 RepID=UPI0020C939DE|nr:hypothetical protein [Bacillus licheniformis]MCP8973110.1 hypothetical protein [Bacillus licheniformis]
MTTVKGLDAILNGGTQFITFKENEPQTLLFIDWYEDLQAIREHYEPSLNPKYIRCPGRDVCPLCAANPGKYPSLKIKFRVFDPKDQKVKFVSLAKKHIQALNSNFNLDEVDPTKNFVTIYRSGSGASDTNYSARAYKANGQDKPELQIPNFDEMGIDVPSLDEQVTPHSPEAIQGFMDALLAGAAQQQQQQEQFPPQQQQQNQFQQPGQFQQNQQSGFPPANQGQASGRKLPF